MTTILNTVFVAEDINMQEVIDSALKSGTAKWISRSPSGIAVYEVGGELVRGRTQPLNDDGSVGYWDMWLKNHDGVFQLAYTVDQLDEIALSGNAVEHDVKVVDSLPRIGDWEFRLVGTHGTPVGNIVLVPRSPRSFALYKKGQIGRFVGYGLTSKQAERLFAERVSYKQEIAALLGEILRNKAMQAAVLMYPGFGPGKGRREWHSNWCQPVFGSDHSFFRLSVWREQALVEAVRLLSK